MKSLIGLLFLLSTTTYAQVVFNFPPACVMTAANSTQRTQFSQFGKVPGFTTGCMVVQADNDTVYEWNGSSYVAIGGSAGSGITSLNSQTGSAQVFANDTNVIMTHSNNTHTIGWTGTLSLARGGSGASLTATNGGIAYSSASALAITPAGTAGSVLFSAGAGVPTWSASGANGNVQSVNVASGNSKNMTFKSGNVTAGGGNSGNTTFKSGSADGNSGSANYGSGDSTTGSGGQVVIVGGNANSDGSNVGGTIGILSGEGSGIGGTSGDITLTIAAGTTKGKIRVDPGITYISSSSGSVGVKAPATVSVPYDMTLPNGAGAAGGIMYYSGSAAISNLAAGTSGQVLVSGGASAPTWGIAAIGPVYNAEVAADGTVSVENAEWITGNCALASSVYTCTVAGFSATPKCLATIHGSASGEIAVNPGSSSSVVVSTFSGTTGLAGDKAFTLQCAK